MDTQKSEGAQRPGRDRVPPRVCAVVLMNHPYPRVLPLLRRLYAGRFHALRFLVPFERLPDPDVITVYRPPYCHAAFLTDAWERLSAIDCDYFMVVHDDILLNPRIDEATFRDFFPLAKDDGFFPVIGAFKENLGAWDWYLGMVPGLLHPKSLLFGSGIEPGNIRRYLPPAELMREKLDAGGIEHVDHVVLTDRGLSEIDRHASRFLMLGLQMPFSLDDAAHAAVRDASADVIRKTIAAMAQAARTVPGTGDTGDDPETGAPRVALPFPIVTGGFYTDLYIVPAAKMADYAHYIGVASAAGLLTEIMAPLILYTLCDRVWSAQECGLDLASYNNDPVILRMLEPRALMTHPYKLSGVLADPEAERRLVHWFDAIHRDGANAALGPIGCGIAAKLALSATAGWHGEEIWGRWSAVPDATLTFWVPEARANAGVRIRLQAPVNAVKPVFTGSVAIGEGVAQPIRFDEELGGIRDFTLPGSDVRPGYNVLTVHADEMVRLCDLDPASVDARWLGFSLWEIELLSSEVSQFLADGVGPGTDAYGSGGVINVDPARSIQKPQIIVNGGTEVSPLIYRDTAQGALVVAKQLKGMGQLGQDLWVAAMTGGRFGGFFVDIGAFDGVDISNTYMLDKQLGWSGILVEPNPELFEYLSINRTGDRLRRVQRAVLTGEEQTLDFVPAGVLGTIAGFEDSDHHSASRHQFSDRTIQVRTISPTELLESNDAPHYIDFMSIDTEGAEWNIVSGFDLNRWRVALFAIEHNHVHEPRAKIRAYLEERGYRCVPCSHDDLFWHPEHLATLNDGLDVNYERINASFTRE